MPPRTNPTAGTGVQAYKPYMWKKPLSPEALETFYYADKVYLFEGRELDKDEVLGVMAVSQRQSMPALTNCARLFDVFDDPNDLLTLEYKALATEHAGQLEAKVHNALRRYHRNYPGAQEFATMVHGIRHRLDFPSSMHGAYWNDKYRIRKHQYVALYIIVNWFRNSDGTLMTMKDRNTIAKKCLFDGQEGETQLMESLSKPKHSAGLKMAAFIEGEKASFIRNTEMLIKSREDRIAPDQIKWCIKEQRIHHVLPTVAPATKAIQELTPGATAGPSPIQRTGQETGKRKEQPQPSYQAESSKRRETGFPDPQIPAPRRSPQHPNDSYGIRPDDEQPNLYSVSDEESEPEMGKDPSGRFAIDRERSAPPPPQFGDSGRISYRAHRPAQSQQQQQQLGDPPPPPLPPVSGRSDRGDKDKRRERR